MAIMSFFFFIVALMECSNAYMKIPHKSRSLGIISQLERRCGKRKFKCNLPPDLAQNISSPFPFIYKGRNAVKGCLPWQVHLTIPIPKDPEFVYVCGGTIIGHRWILTAAHCASDFPVGNEGVIITAGITDLRKIKSRNQFGVKKAFLHPKYNKPVRNNNDVALLKLSKYLHFNDHVQPACLPLLAEEKRLYAAGNKVIISGWGHTRGRHPKGQILQVARVPLTSQAECKEDLGSQYVPTDICAGNLGPKHKDTCEGDSGGPLGIEVNGIFTVLGITSRGDIKCGDGKNPGQYTNVAKELKWIKDTIARN